MALFKKSKQNNEKPPLKNKKVQFVWQKMSEINALISEDKNAVLKFEPVNYYMNKDRFILCTLMFDEEYSNIFMGFTEVVNDKEKASTENIRIDFELLKGILRKFGQVI